MTMITMDAQDRASRVWLIGSLALNLFFVGTVGALTARHYIAPSRPAAVERPRTAAARIERLAAALAPGDAEKLRAAFGEQVVVAERAREALSAAFERVQAALRAEPFDPAQLNAAFAAAREARLAYDTIIQQIISAAAQTMSHEGRNRLAEGPRPNTNTR